MESAKEKSFFTRVFPTPKFLAMPAVGIDISDDSIRFVELVNKKEGKILSRFGEYKIPAGLVLNGEIQDVEKLSEELKKIKELLDSGIINEEDFEKMKQNIIDNM